LGSQALYLFIKRLNFLSVSCALGFRRIGAAQFFQRFLNGEFGCFSHGNPHIQASKVDSGAPPVEIMGTSYGDRVARTV
jgi:hypothetical protein